MPIINETFQRVETPLVQWRATSSRAGLQRTLDPVLVRAPPSERARGAVSRAVSAARRWCVQRGLPQSPGFKGGGDNEAESLRFLLTALHAAVQDVGHSEPTEHRGGAGGAHADEVRHLRACACVRVRLRACDAPISNGMLSETRPGRSAAAVAHATSNTRTA
jgi:hypothetical protein